VARPSRGEGLALVVLVFTGAAGRRSRGRRGPGPA
jgi:hypothetical protein